MLRQAGGLAVFKSLFAGNGLVLQQAAVIPVSGVQLRVADLEPFGGAGTICSASAPLFLQGCGNLPCISAGMRKKKRSPVQHNVGDRLKLLRADHSIG